nr:tetratricopeptide repeat protein [Paenibacillus psychroresistens]
MKAIINVISIIIIVIVALVFAFKTHFLLGIALVLLLIGFAAFRGRANYYAIRGTKLFSSNEFEQSLVWFKKAYESKPCPEAHQIGYGYILMRTGNAKQAEQVFKQVLRTTKNKDNRIQAQCNLATSYWLQGRNEECLVLLEEVFEQYKNSLVYGNLGYFKLLNGDFESALAFNQEAYAYNGDDKTIVDNLAYNYYMLGQLEQAEEMFALLIPKSPKFADPHYFYALTLEKLGKLDEAAEQIQIAQSKDIAFITPIIRAEIDQAALRLNVSSEEVV